MAGGVIGHFPLSVIELELCAICKVSELDNFDRNLQRMILTIDETIQLNTGFQRLVILLRYEDLLRCLR